MRSKLATSVFLALALLAALAPVAHADGKWGAQRVPPPIIYAFFDWGSDFNTTHPEYGPVGSMHMLNWYQINPAPGVFDWSLPDRNIAREAALRVTLRDGQVIPKPVVIQVAFYLGQNAYQPCSGTYFWDGTPQWVYDQIDQQRPGDPRPLACGRKVGHLIQGPASQAAMPMFDSMAWRNAYLAMVAALGAHYRDDPRVVAVMITTGLDGETQLAKPSGGCDWSALADRQVPGLGLAFRSFTFDAMAAYRAAFPATPVLVQNTPGTNGMRRETANRTTWVTPPIGMHHCGLTVDAQNHHGWGSEVGTWDWYATLSQTVPIWVESAYSFANPEEMYWSWLAGTAYHPDAADVHPSWLEKSDPAWLHFVQDHLGRTLADTPDVWVVLRDTEYPPITWGTSGQSGHPGDWSFWLSASGGTRVWRRDLPAVAQPDVRSRQCRRVDTAMLLGIAPGVWFRSQVGGCINLDVLDSSTDSFVLQYHDRSGAVVSQAIERHGTDLWRTVDLTVDDIDLAAGFSVVATGAPVYLHRVIVAPLEGLPPAPVPATATPTATIAPTPTATPTATPAPGPAFGDGPLGMVLIAVGLTLLLAGGIVALLAYIERRLA